MSLEPSHPSLALLPCRLSHVGAQGSLAFHLVLVSFKNLVKSYLKTIFKKSGERIYKALAQSYVLQRTTQRLPISTPEDTRILERRCIAPHEFPLGKRPHDLKYIPVHLRQTFPYMWFAQGLILAYTGDRE